MKFIVLNTGKFAEVAKNDWHKTHRQLQDLDTEEFCVMVIL